MSLVQPIQHVQHTTPVVTPFNDTQLVAFVAALLYQAGDISPVPEAIEIVAESLVRMRNGDLQRAVDDATHRLAEAPPRV